MAADLLLYTPWQIQKLKSSIQTSRKLGRVVHTSIIIDTRTGILLQLAKSFCSGRELSMFYMDSNLYE